MFRLLRPFPLTILLALAVAFFANQAAKADQMMRQDSADFSLHPHQWRNGDAQVYFNLHESAPIFPDIVADAGDWISREARRMQLFELRVALQVRVPAEELTREGFWDFSNLAQVLSDIQFRPHDRDQRADMSYPVRETTFGVFPDRMNCQMVQRRYTPDTPRFQAAWARWTSEQKENVGEPALLVIQECSDFNMLFAYTTQSLFLIPNGPRTDVLVDARAFPRRDVVRKLDMIPFLNVEKKIGNSILKEVLNFRQSVEQYFQN